MTFANGSDEDPIIIKKYANRRLYDTSTSAYVTLEHLSALVRDGKQFVVQDAKTGEDLTRGVLAQIIFEQENRRDGVLPVGFLRQLIQFYGESFQSMLPAYLEMSMKNFAAQQEKWRDYMHTALGDGDRPRTYDEQVRKNMEMFEDAMRLFTPFPARTKEEEQAEIAPDAPAPSPSGVETTSAQASGRSAGQAGGADLIRDLQQQMAAMQKQLSALAAGQPGPPTEKGPGRGGQGGTG